MAPSDRHDILAALSAASAAISAARLHLGDDMNEQEKAWDYMLTASGRLVRYVENALSLPIEENE